VTVEPQPELRIGRVLKAHGVKGAVRIELLTDFPDRFAPGREVRVAGRRLTVARSEELEGSMLVTFAGIDDRNAAEDLVQEAFIRLARGGHRIRDASKAPAYLRSIVLNLARDHNRRGLMSLRHHLPQDDQAAVEDEITLRDDQQHVIDALRELPHRQRDCIVLRYYDDLGIDDIAATLGISRNSVKTHLGRALRTLEGDLASEFAPNFDAAAGVVP